MPRETSETVYAIGAIAAIVAGGIGLVTGQRWGWLPAFAIALLAFAVGIWNAITDDDSGPVPQLIVVVLPVSLMLWSLLAPETRAWLLRRERAHPRPEDEPWVRRS